MRPVAPACPLWEERSYHGDDYRAMTYAVATTDADPPQPVTVTRWRPTEDERALLLAGQDVFVFLHGGLPPMQVHIGNPYASTPEAPHA